jgi:hypothetical protein
MAPYVEGTRIPVISLSLSFNIAFVKSMAAPDPTPMTVKAPVRWAARRAESIFPRVGNTDDTLELTVFNPNSMLV